MKPLKQHVFIIQVCLTSVSGIFYTASNVSKKVKFSCYRPEQALGDPVGYGSGVFRLSAL